MSFDTIPEDREESYECPQCGGDVTLQDNKWECNNCSYPNNKESD